MERTEDAWSPRVAWIALLALVLIRAVTAFLPSMWAWGLDAQRFVSPLPAWGLWVAMALLLVPSVGARVNASLERAGDRALGSAWMPWLASLAAAALVWTLPDRTGFTGDFMLRQGAAETGAFPGIFAQSLPLERFLNQGLPRMFGSVFHADPILAVRGIEALAAAALCRVSFALAREWELTGGAAVAAAGTILFGGYLSCFTGLGKPAALLCALTAATLLGATRLVRTGRGGLLLGAALAAACLIHRSALALAPLWIMAVILAARAHRGDAHRPWVQLAFATVLPLMAFLAVGPRLWRILVDFDLPRHLRPGGEAGGGLLSLAFSPLHLVDLANLLLFYTPAAVTAGMLLLTPGPPGHAGPERRLPAVLALSFVPLLLFIHPLQGIVRDLEVFAPAGLAVAALAGLLTGDALQRRRLPAWLAPALLASVVVPALHWLLHFHDPDRGYARVRALALEAPGRSEVVRARLWDMLAYRAFRERRWDRAVEASEQAVRFAPHPRAVTMLAIARTYTGDYRGAESLYVGLTRRTPEDPLVWLGLGGVSLRLGDSLQAARALTRLEAYPPESREARMMRRHLRAFPEVWPTTAAGSRP